MRFNSDLQKYGEISSIRIESHLKFETDTLFSSSLNSSLVVDKNETNVKIDGKKTYLT